MKHRSTMLAVAVVSILLFAVPDPIPLIDEFIFAISALLAFLKLFKSFFIKG